jgi:glycosyltransferase involved in cell wall biosynthesis
MKIGLEAERANLPNPTGVEHYAYQLIKNLAEIDNANEYILYFRTKPQEWFYSLPKNFKLKVMPFPKFWTQARLSFEMAASPVDVLAILASALPIYHPKNSVVTVHDIAFEYFPEAFTPFMRRYLVWSTRFAVRHARKIISVSESTKNDLVKTYGLAPEKIEVVHLGLGGGFKPRGYEDVQPVLDSFGLTYKKYILFVGTLQPRKNIVKLVDAYLKLRKENRIEEKLVLAGGKGWLWEPILRKIGQASEKDSVVFLNYLGDNDLKAVLSGASLLTLPSIYEGFGLPPLEAMASGVPVVVSNVSSMPEVVSDAGALVDPNSVDSIAAGLLKVLTDKGLSAQMVEKGLARARLFNWKATAEKTLRLFESLK